MANEFELSPKELKRQADALLAAADAAEKAAEREPAARSAKKSTRKKGEETAQEAPAVTTGMQPSSSSPLRAIHLDSISMKPKNRSFSPPLPSIL